MKSSLTSNDVLQDIEFELMQGALSRHALGQSIRAIRQYQNKLRGEFFQSARSTVDTRELISRQFQINDMLLTLLQEMSATIQAMQLNQKQLARRAAMLSVPVAHAPTVISRQHGAINEPAAAVANADSAWRLTEEVESAMTEDALKLDLEVRAGSIPIIGALLTRLRAAFHSLALFYALRLANKQSPINRTYGDWILHLTELQQQQQEQIRILNAQLTAMQAHSGEDGQL